MITSSTVTSCIPFMPFHDVLDAFYEFIQVHDYAVSMFVIYFAFTFRRPC